jgi:hypothetical protein
MIGRLELGDGLSQRNIRESFMLVGSKIKTQSWLLIVFLFLLQEVGAAQDVAEPASPAKVVVAGPFRIHVHVDQQEVTDRVREIGEQAWKVASKLYGSELPKKKLDVHLYRTVEGYLAADEELTGGKFKMNQAFAHFDTTTAHVALQPPISDELLDSVGLPKQSARLLAHEMSHLVRFKRMPNTFRNHPYWLIDGMASLVDQQVLVAAGYMDQWSEDPHFGSYAWNGKRLLSENKLPTATELLSNESLDVGFFDRSSVRWIFIDMLVSKHGDKFKAFLKELPRLGGGSGYAKRTEELLLKHMRVDSVALDRLFVQHVEQLKPQWCEQGRSLETFGTQWRQIAFPNSTATTWRQKPLTDSFRISTTATIHNAGRNQLNIRIGRRDSFTQFSVTAGYGLNVFEFADKKWETKIAKEIADIEVGEPMKLSLDYDHEKGQAILKLDGEIVFQDKVEFAADSQVALGAQKSSAVTWQDFKVDE